MVQCGFETALIKNKVLIKTITSFSMKSLKKLFGIFDEKTESMKETVNVSDVSNESSKAESREVNDEPVEKAKGTSSSQKGEDQAPENVNDENQSNSVKSKIYNMLIVDESGSMSGLTQVTLSGVNEIISTIREAQNKHADVQQHYITLVTFDERNDNKVLPIRTIWNALPISEVSDFKDYRPQGCTPLYDAVGDSLRNLHEKIKHDEDATGVVTILTDGLENASRRWNAFEVKRLIEQLKEEGWSFSYMGSAHNVKDVTDILSIDNAMEFSHDQTGAYNTWGREKASRNAYYEKMASCSFSVDDDWEMKKQRKRQFAREYYSERVTPEHVTHLASNEVFVFGSNNQGHHDGGAAAWAMQAFGAVWGQAEGLQGQSYAIPTTDGIGTLQEAVKRFAEYAAKHPEKKFLVTRIGCGNAGYSADVVAPLFGECVSLENVSLPYEFWKCLGLHLDF